MANDDNNVEWVENVNTATVLATLSPVLAFHFLYSVRNVRSSSVLQSISSDYCWSGMAQQ